MARKSANKTIIETVTWNKDLAEGATLEGYYINKETFEGQFGETTKYVIESADDDTKYGVYGSASLDRQFKNIPEGCFVWITYDGKVTSKNGRLVNQYTVDFDDEIVK